MTALREEFRAILSQIYVAVPFTRLVDEFWELILQFGVNIELGLHAEALERFTRNQFQDTARKLRDRGIKTTLHAAFMDLVPASPDPAIRRVSRERILQVLDLVPLFEPDSVVCHLGFYPQLHQEVREQWLDLALEFWSSLVPRLEEHQTPVMLENVFEREPRLFLDILEEVNSPYLRFCFDTGHTLAFSPSPWRDWLTALEPWLGQIHAHDNTGQADDHQAVGRGVFPFKDLFQWLAARDIRPLVTLEAHSEQWVWESLPHLVEIWPWEA